MKSKRVFYILFIVLMSSISMASLLYAYPYGRIGRSGKQGATCSSCHFGPNTPTLELSGPTEIMAGDTVDFILTVDRNSDTETVTTAGFNIAIDAGTLLGKNEIPVECRDPSQGIPEHSNKTCISLVDGLTEIGHAQPTLLDNGKVSFSFSYIAPDTPGTVVFYGAGVAATSGAGAFSDKIHAGNTTFTMTITSAGTELPPTPAIKSNFNLFASTEYMFDGGQSVDDDGTIVKYLWSFGDETFAEGQMATHTYDSAGEYTVLLDVEDNDGNRRTTTSTITVEESVEVQSVLLPFVGR